MLAQEQLQNWFASNGIDIGIPFPRYLLKRLCYNALSMDKTLFEFLEFSFKSHTNDHLILKFTSWTDAFTNYQNPLYKIQ